MKTVTTVFLILIGTVWLYYATIIPTVMETRPLSDAMQLESTLNAWAAEKVSAGQLEESDVQELFHENYSLRFGGEQPEQGFRQMIKDIAKSSAPPAWPGALSILLGVVGMFVREPKQAEAEGDGERRSAP